MLAVANVTTTITTTTATTTLQVQGPNPYDGLTLVISVAAIVIAAFAITFQRRQVNQDAG